MAWILLLAQGDTTVNLASTWRVADESLVIESPEETTVYSEPVAYASSVTRLGKTIGKRRIRFKLVSSALGISALKLQYQQLLDFFERARRANGNKADEPCYLIIGDGAGYDKPPLFGGGCIWHKILDADVVPEDETFGLGLVLSKMEYLIVNVSIDCTLGEDLTQWLLNANGFVRFDQDNGSLKVYRGFTNLIHNPGFEHGTFSTDWTSSNANLTATVEYERVFSGYQAARLTSVDTSTARTYTVTLTLAQRIYLMSAYVYTDGTAVTSSDCCLVGQGSAITTTFTAVSSKPGWYRMTGLFTGLPLSSTHGIQVEAGKVVYLDDVLLVQFDATRFSVSSGNLLSNTGFETAGGGGADVFANWTETAGDGTITDSATAQAGSHACLLTAGPSTNTKVGQSGSVTAGSAYFIYFYTRGDGTYAGRLTVWDDQGAAAIGGLSAVSTGITGTTYTLCSCYFVAPIGCTSVTLELVCPGTNTGAAYFDTVVFKAWPTGTFFFPEFPLDDGYAGPGVAWASTVHDSNQTATDGLARLRMSWSAFPGSEPLFFGKGALSMWVKTPHGGDDGLYHYLVDSYVTSTTYRFMIWKHVTSGYMYFRMYGASGDKLLGGSIQSTWTANTWHHVFVTWDDGAPVSLYFDGVLVSSNVVTTGTWVKPNRFGTHLYLGCDQTNIGYQLDGEIADVRIFGPDATVTVADLYAAGCGMSNLPFVLADTSTANPLSIAGTTDSTYKNRFWIGNLPGDLPSPLRFFLGVHADINNRVFIGFDPYARFPHNLNVIEGESYVAGSGVSVVVSAGRSGGNLARLSGANTYIICPLISDARELWLLRGRFRVFAVVKNGGTSNSDFAFRVTILQNYTSLASSLSYGIQEAGEYKYGVNFGNWEVVDMGSFSIPPSMLSELGYKKTREGVKEMSYPVGIYFDCIRYLGASDLDVDYFVIMRDEFLWRAGEGNGNLGGFVCIDSLSLPTVVFNSNLNGDSDVHLEGRESEGMFGKPLFFPPRTWVFCNVLSEAAATQDPSDTMNPQAQCKPVYRW